MNQKNSNTTQEQDMSPDASPGGMDGKSGVRKVNNMPMYLLGVVFALFLLIMALVASDRSAKQNVGSVPTDVKKNGSTTNFAKGIVGDKTSGLIEASAPALVPASASALAPAPASASASAPAIKVAMPDNLDEPPRPARPGNGPGSAPAPVDDEANRIRTAKLQRFDEAVKARTSVAITSPRSAGSAAPSSKEPQTRDEMLARLSAVRQQLDGLQRDDPTAAYQQRLAQVRALGIGQGANQDSSAAPNTSSAQLGQAGVSGRNNINQFAGKAGRWKLDAEPEAPNSQFELRAGFVIPATLISGINSDLPGQIMAQVSQDVFDTPSGKFLLIPQGSRLVGTYSSDVSFGQGRVLVAWQRIIFPDGKALDLGAMAGADSAGYGGLADQVNNHYVRLFGSAFLLSGVTAGVAYSQRNQGASNQPTAGSALSEALGQQLGQVTAQLIARNMSIAPTLEIRPGYRFNVVVTKDLTFKKPYRSFDY